MKAEEAEASGEPRPENPDDSRDSDLDIGENDESPSASPKGERGFESRDNSDDDDIDVDASDTEEDYLHQQQTLMAAHLRLYQSAAEAAVQQEPGLKISAAAASHNPRLHGEHSVAQTFLRSSPTQHDINWSKQSSIV